MLREGCSHLPSSLQYRRYGSYFFDCCRVTGAHTLRDSSAVCEPTRGLGTSRLRRRPVHRRLSRPRDCPPPSGHECWCESARFGSRGHAQCYYLTSGRQYIGFVQQSGHTVSSQFVETGGWDERGLCLFMTTVKQCSDCNSSSIRTLRGDTGHHCSCTVGRFTGPHRNIGELSCITS